MSYQKFLYSLERGQLVQLFIVVFHDFSFLIAQAALLSGSHIVVCPTGWEKQSALFFQLLLFIFTLVPSACHIYLA